MYSLRSSPLFTRTSNTYTSTSSTRSTTATSTSSTVSPRRVLAALTLSTVFAGVRGESYSDDDGELNMFYLQLFSLIFGLCLGSILFYAASRDPGSERVVLALLNRIAPPPARGEVRVLEEPQAPRVRRKG